MEHLDCTSWMTNIQLFFIGGGWATSFPIHTPVLAGLSRDWQGVTQYTAHLLLSGLSVSVHNRKNPRLVSLSYSTLSLEQRQRRSGMVGIGRERCWDGDNNRYLACLQEAMAHVHDHVLLVVHFRFWCLAILWPDLLIGTRGWFLTIWPLILCQHKLNKYLWPMITSMMRYCHSQRLLFICGGILTNPIRDARDRWQWRRRDESGMWPIVLSRPWWAMNYNPRLWQRLSWN